MSKQTIYTCDRCLKTGDGDDIYRDDVSFGDEDIKIGARIHLCWDETNYKDLCKECRESLEIRLTALLRVFFKKIDVN